ncbi:MAG: anaerobic ribonucleoside-triphosphate reductase [Promethearchaeota archaeon]
MKSINYEHAAQRKTFVGLVYAKGSSEIKETILNSLEDRFSKLHREGRIHIHDLEAYGITYNCLTPNILQGFPYDQFEHYSELRKILEILNYYKLIIVGLGNEQSGGIGIPNFDGEIETLYKNLNISINDNNLQFLSECIDSLMKWINEARDRCGQVQYYVTLNLGLTTSELGRFVTSAVLKNFKRSDYIRPNIIFKLKDGINRRESDPNYDLFCLAKECTCKKMIPTYFLGDSNHNLKVDPYKIALMGCRSKVYQNNHGEDTTIGRANIVYNTINLPRIALEIENSSSKLTKDEKIQLFKEEWLKIAETVKDLLFDRFYKVCKLDPDDFTTNLLYNLRIIDLNKVKSMEEVFKNGTLSIGFIGLSEAIELLTGEKFYSSKENHKIAIDIVEMMKNTIDEYRRKYDMNFSLLGTSGEFISGRFPNEDKKYFSHPLIEKGFYTNSFHVDVDSGLNPFDKLRYEGVFHKFCNGGCISYVEFQSAPLNNVEAISELIEYAIAQDINYLGFNFPMDRCMDCGVTGTFDDCENCGSKNIQRIRRVSGYLEDSEFFTSGKKAEVSYRKPNI